MKDSLKKYVSATPKNCFQWQKYIFKKTRRKWYPTVEEWLIYKKWTLICIMVSTRAKLALNKKTLDKKPVSTLQNK